MCNFAASAAKLLLPLLIGVFAREKFANTNNKSHMTNVEFCHCVQGSAPVGVLPCMEGHVWHHRARLVIIFCAQEICLVAFQPTHFPRVLAHRCCCCCCCFNLLTRPPAWCVWSLGRSIISERPLHFVSFPLDFCFVFCFVCLFGYFFLQCFSSLNVLPLLRVTKPSSVELASPQLTVGVKHVIIGHTFLPHYSAPTAGSPWA